MADNDAKAEKLDIGDLLRTLISRLTSIEDVQKELRDGQKETNKHLVQLNGTVGMHGQQIGYLERRDQVKSGKLDDHDGQIAQFMARLAVVERVTEVRDEHLRDGVREAKTQSWEGGVEARDLGRELRGWAGKALLFMAAAFIVALLVVAFLALIWSAWGPVAVG